MIGYLFPVYLSSMGKLELYLDDRCGEDDSSALFTNIAAAGPALTMLKIYRDGIYRSRAGFIIRMYNRSNCPKLQNLGTFIGGSPTALSTTPLQAQPQSLKASWYHVWHFLGFLASSRSPTNPRTIRLT